MTSTPINPLERMIREQLHEMQGGMPANLIEPGLLATFAKTLYEKAGNAIVITNAASSPKQFYTMLITDKEIQLAEKTGTKITHTFFHFGDQSFSRDNEKLSRDFAKEFGRRLENILRDIQQKKAEMYQKDAGVSKSML